MRLWKRFVGLTNSYPIRLPIVARGRSGSLLADFRKPRRLGCDADPQLTQFFGFGYAATCIARDD